jgi:hypothetical protein
MDTSVLSALSGEHACMTCGESLLGAKAEWYVFEAGGYRLMW